MSQSMMIHPTPVVPRSGQESFGGLDAQLADFWSWAFSDLRDNITGGLLVEWAVARTLGDERPIRTSWDTFDVLMPEGVKVEVKSSGYLQGWPQRVLSKINFGKLMGRDWDPENGHGDVRCVRADVFVFGVQTAQTHEAYDQLDFDQFEFFVVPGDRVRCRSVSLGWVKANATHGPITLGDVRDAVLTNRSEELPAA
jgi:hypothetical protein